MLRFVSNLYDLFYQKTSEIIYQKQDTFNIHIDGIPDLHFPVNLLVFYGKKNLFKPASGTGQSSNEKFNLEHKYKIP